MLTDTETGSASVNLIVTLTTENTINVRANFIGATSGIASYEFKIGTSQSNLQTIETRQTDTRQYDYTYRKLNETTNLAANTTYYVQVIAHDIVGDAKTSVVRSAKTTYNNYVEPMIPTDQSRTGMTVDYMPEETAGWAIWGEDENYLYLISRDAKQVTLRGFTSLEAHLNTLDLAAQTYASSKYTRSISKVYKRTRPYTRKFAIAI